MTAFLTEQDIELLEADDEFAEDEEGFFREADDEFAEDEEVYLYEADDEFAEDDEADDERLAERRYFGRRRRPARSPRSRPGYGRHLQRRTARGTGLSRGIVPSIRGVRSAQVHTPQGTAQIQLPEAVVSKAELQTALSALSSRVGKEIRQNSGAIADLKQAIKSEDSSTRKSFSGLESKLAGFEKSVNQKQKQSQDQTMMYALLPMVMQTKPQLESLTVTQGDEEPKKFTVNESKFKAADPMTTMMPLVLMMGMGGLGGSGGSQNNMMMMLVLVMMMQQQSSQK